MDPLADKLLVCTALILFVWSNSINPIVVIVIVGRDFIISGKTCCSKQRKIIAAHFGGKIKTLIQMLMIVLVLLEFQWKPLYILTKASIVIAFVLTIVSLIDYIIKNKSIWDRVCIVV